MTMSDAQKGFFCTACGWNDFGRYPLWKQLPRTHSCPECGAEAESGTLVGPDHPSFSATERARLRWLLNATTYEAFKPG
jgi:rubredoxin